MGGALGVGLLAAFGLVADGPGGFPYVWDAFIVAGVLGTLLGGVLAPLAGWLFLRHVPFSHVFAGTATGTAVGAGIGLFASGLDPLVAVGGAVTGFALAIVLLRVRSRPLQVKVDAPTG